MHISVLLNEVVDCLNLKPNENFVDCTFGFGGHTLALLKENKPNGKGLAIERDGELFLQGKKINEKRLTIVNDSFGNLKKICQENNFYPVKAILMDLGFSSWHIEQSKRGFTFQQDEPLDMRYNQSQELTAREIINVWPREEIEKIFQQFGEEKLSRKISLEIIRQRKMKPILSTYQLSHVIESVNSFKPFKQKIHPATRCFQALRIAVNGELDILEKALPQTIDVLQTNGRLAIISFHSLEDRIIKNFFKDCQIKGLGKIITKKPIAPSYREINKNKKARSAKLRIMQKI